jgi:hypothetical protein
MPGGFDKNASQPGANLRCLAIHDDDEPSLEGPVRGARGDDGVRLVARPGAGRKR